MFEKIMAEQPAPISSRHRASEIDAELVKFLYEKAPFAFLAIVINALILVTIEWQVVSHPALVIWLAFTLVLTAARYLLVRRFWQLSPGPSAIGRWEILFSVGALLSGLGWGATAVFFFPEGADDHRLFITFVLAGMTAGAVTTLSPRMVAFLLFVIPALLPLGVRLYASNSTMGAAMGTMVALFMLLMVFIARNTSMRLRESVALRFENSKMLVSLQEAKDRVERLNAKLVAEGEERKQAMEVLQRQTEELIKSNTGLERFAHVASHDLKEPLRTISAYIKLLAKRYHGRLDSDADEFIRYAVEGTRRMEQLIHDVLMYYKVGSQEKRFAGTDLNTVVERALENLKTAIEESQAVIISDTLPRLSVNDSEFLQLFQNLISNAIKFRGDLPPFIRITAQQKKEEWLFLIEDNGIGFEQEYAERVFGIFQRLHGPGEYPGTGIGLTICKKIVEGHGGRIWAESEPQKGSRFYFALSATGRQESQL